MREPVFRNFKKILMGLLYSIFFALVGTLMIPFSAQRASAQVIYTPTPMEIQTADQVINAVNSLRVANGLPSLSVHPILMQVAQWEVDALVNGAGGHTRPDNMTLGQQLLSLGYPLSGDLSQDGYRSENIVWGPGFTVQDAIRLWGSDDPHLNTMLSPNRSDIGVAVASSLDEWGFTVYCYVLETALQTRSGQMQYDAYPILTAIAAGQVAAYGDATQAAGALLVPQYIVPVVRATAWPDGDVIHEVKNGQSLWSIATGYGVKIDQIRQLNNLSSTDIYLGQKLLVQKGATQPVPTSLPTFASTAYVSTSSPTPVADQIASLPPVVPASASSLPRKTSITGIVVGIILLALLMAALLSRLFSQ